MSGGRDVRTIRSFTHLPERYGLGTTFLVTMNMVLSLSKPLLKVKRTCSDSKVSRMLGVRSCLIILQEPNSIIMIVPTVSYLPLGDCVNAVPNYYAMKIFLKDTFLNINE